MFTAEYREKMKLTNSIDIKEFIKTNENRFCAEFSFFGMNGKGIVWLFHGGVNITAHY